MCQVRSVTYVSGRLANPDSAGCARALAADRRGLSSLLYTLAVYAWHLGGAFRIFGRRWTRTLVDHRQLASSGSARYILAENDKTRVKSSVIIPYWEGLPRQEAFARSRPLTVVVSKPFHGLVQHAIASHR
jgi:hypothetical protein